MSFFYKILKQMIDILLLSKVNLDEIKIGDCYYTPIRLGSMYSGDWHSGPENCERSLSNAFDLSQKFTLGINDDRNKLFLSKDETPDFSACAY
jgi:hypothetical protein